MSGAVGKGLQVFGTSTDRGCSHLLSAMHHVTAVLTRTGHTFRVQITRMGVFQFWPHRGFAAHLPPAVLIAGCCRHVPIRNSFCRVTNTCLSSATGDPAGQSAGSHARSAFSKCWLCLRTAYIQSSNSNWFKCFEVSVTGSPSSYRSVCRRTLGIRTPLRLALSKSYKPNHQLQIYKLSHNCISCFCKWDTDSQIAQALHSVSSQTALWALIPMRLEGPGGAGCPVAIQT